MSGWTEADRCVGLWSATGAAAIGVVFVVVGLAGVVARPPGPDPLHQVDPYLAILEILMMLAVRRGANHNDGCAPHLRRTRPEDLRPGISRLRSYFLPSDLQRAFRKANRVATEQSGSLALAEKRKFSALLCERLVNAVIGNLLSGRGNVR